MSIGAGEIGHSDALRAALALLGTAFNRAVDKPLATAYWIALRDLTPEQIALAAERALATCKFFPVPSELRALVGQTRNVGAEAALAWQGVRKAIDRYDYSVGSIDFGPRVNAVVRNLGGWDTLCTAKLSELDNPGWLRKRFEEVYAFFAETDPAMLTGDPLPGSLEARGRGDVCVALPGQPAPLRLGTRNGGTNGVLGLLAEEKSA